MRASEHVNVYTAEKLLASYMTMFQQLMSEIVAVKINDQSFLASI